MTEAGHPIEQAQATDILRKLSDKAATHALLKNNDSYDECFVTDRYGPDEFHGINEKNKVDIQAATWVERKGEAKKGERDQYQQNYVLIKSFALFPLLYYEKKDC
jgi:hypothetical protein